LQQAIQDRWPSLMRVYLCRSAVVKERRAADVCLPLCPMLTLSVRMADLFTVLTPHEAWSRLEPHLHPIDRVEAVPTAEALGRVLAEDTRAQRTCLISPAPPWMATRCVRDTHGATEGLPAYLKVVGEIAMGKAAGMKLSPVRRP